MARREIIGALRTDLRMFVCETVLSLLAPRRQQGRDPYEELQRVARDNEMVPWSDAAPAVDSLG